MKRITFFFFLMLLATAAAVAQLPQAVSFQAVLRDGNTLLANRSVGVRLSIRQGAADGAVVYAETHSVSTNANGLLVLPMGMGSVEQGAFATIDWANGPYYAVSEADPAGGSNYSLTTVQQILSVPYALYAHSAANVADTAASLRQHYDAEIARIEALVGSTPADPCLGRTTRGIDEQTATDSYTWIDGNTYSASTVTPTYTIRGGNAAGCDSIVTLHLAIVSSIPQAENMEGCECSGTVAVNGALPGLFSISANKKVRFSQGNLQYTTVGTHACADSTMKQGTWRFADCQCQYAGGNNGHASETYTDYIDQFCWATSGYHNSADSYNTRYYPFSREWSFVNEYNYFGYGPSITRLSPNLTEGSRYYDWGVYNAIANGGNLPNLWRTLTSDEWLYLFNTRNGSTIGLNTNVRYCKATLRGVAGVVLFPDDYTHPASAPILTKCNTHNASYSSNVFTHEVWQDMEVAGAVFLPYGSVGTYWSTTYCSDNCTTSYSLKFANDGLNPQNGSYRREAVYVRLVMEVE